MINGITRKIDELGRIVVPKEIRKKLNIKVGEPLDLSISDKESFIVKKSSSMNDILYYSEELALSIYNNTTKICLITDLENVVAVGNSKKQLINKKITNKTLDIIKGRLLYESKLKGMFKVLEDDENEYNSFIILPVIASSDIVGSIILLTDKLNLSINSSDILVVKTIGNFLSMKIEL